MVKQKVHRRRSKKGKIFKAGSRIPIQVIKKEKGFSWKQIHKKHPKVSAVVDSDGDGKKNYEDCRPFDKKKQDLTFNPEDEESYKPTDYEKQQMSDESYRFFRDDPVSKWNRAQIEARREN